MRRCFSTIFSALSLLLCVLIVTLWVQTYHGIHRLGWEHAHFLPSEGVTHRAIIDMMCNPRSTLITVARWSEDSVGRSTSGSRWFWEAISGHSVLTFYPQINRSYFYFHLRQGGVVTTTARGTGTVLRLGAPNGLLVPVFLMLPIFWLMRFLRERRRRRNQQCVMCGYDLRATRDRCPECGMIPQGGSSVDVASF